MGSSAVRLGLLRSMAVAGLALLAGGCSLSATALGNPHVVVARDSFNGKTMRIRVGERLELILGSSYWNVDDVSSPAALRQDGPTSLLATPGDCSTIPGSGCTPEQTSYTALAPGAVVITASRDSCGEALACLPDQRHFRLTVIVS